ncbi:MAG: tRNA (mo5U34)-methyltransferase [Solirubrobacteraceae bacterium]|nr:tRNA (mo5U34)-methyltransferase [Solirubrobacteraceae bacterium]
MLLKAWLWGSRGRRNVMRAVRPLGPVSATLAQYAPGGSFVDVGAIWSVHGKIAFAAEELGATSVTAVDVSPETPEYEAEHKRRGSAVRFVQGDIHAPATIEAIGPHDTVWCSGVLYHCPNPAHTIDCLRSITRKRLVLITASVPEVPGVRNAGVFFPGLGESERKAYDRAYNAASNIPAARLGLTTPFDPAEEYGNWFWGLSPSAIEAMLQASGFAVEETKTNGFHTRVVARLEGA